MKYIITFLAFIAISTTAFSQSRGTYGTIQAITPAVGSLYKYSAGVITAVPTGKLDTLSNTDTGLVRWTFNNLYSMTFDYYVTKISGTVGGTALLQGSTDNTNWHTITGNTTYCAGCIGASATVTNTAGSTHYQWYVPAEATTYKYWQVQTITTGTMTASYNGTVQYGY